MVMLQVKQRPAPLYKGDDIVHENVKIRCLRACQFKSGQWYHHLEKPILF